jgi:hypothetical protein
MRASPLTRRGACASTQRCRWIRPRRVPGLEGRFLSPFLARHFGADFPRLAYAVAQKADALPANVHVEEFYLQSGGALASRQAQSSYNALNYTHVARTVAARGIRPAGAPRSGFDGRQATQPELQSGPQLRPARRNRAAGQAAADAGGGGGSGVALHRRHRGGWPRVLRSRGRTTRARAEAVRPAAPAGERRRVRHRSVRQHAGAATVARCR